jgi:hypothetical protein
MRIFLCTFLWVGLLIVASILPLSVAALAPLPGSLQDKLIAYYPFNGDANDYSGNDNSGVIQGSVNSIDDRFGNKNSAFSFIGSGYVEVTNGMNFNLGEMMTVALWVKPLQNGNVMIIDKSNYFAALHETLGGWGIYAPNRWMNSYYFLYDPEQNQQFTTNLVGLNQGGWTHLAFVKNNTEVIAYLNGNEVSRQSFASPVIFANGDLPLTIGGTNSGQTNPASLVVDMFIGHLDDIFVYNRSLTSEEVLELSLFSGQPVLDETASLPNNLAAGLVAYYPFNGNVLDASGNGNSGVIQGEMTIREDRFGVPNSAYTFNGRGYIEVIQGSSFNFQDSDMTISLWVCPAFGGFTLFDKTHYSSSQGNSVIAGWGVASPAGRNNEYVSFYIPSVGVEVDSALIGLPPGQWTHVTFVKNGNQSIVYLNGDEKTRTTFATSSIAPNGHLPLLLGAANYGYSIPASNIGSVFIGIMDDIFIYNRALSSEEVRELSLYSEKNYQADLPARITYGLVAYYPLNGNALDASGNGNNGVNQGNMQIHSFDRYANLDNAYSFNGGYIEVIKGSSFNFENDMTVSLWVCPLQTGGFIILEKTHYSGDLAAPVAGWGIYSPNWWEAAYYFFYVQSIGHEVDSPLIGLNQRTWSHLTFVKNGNQSIIYLNGAEMSRTTLDSSEVASSGDLPFLIGAGNNGYSIPASNIHDQFIGYMDDIFVYNRSLSTEEVYDLFLYSVQNPTNKEPSLAGGISDGLVAYYPFDGTTIDASGNENHGFIQDWVGPSTDREGNPNSAMQFFGHGYIEIPGRQFNFKNNLTISFWIEPSSSQNDWSQILSKSHYNSLAGWDVEQFANNLNAIIFASIYPNDPAQSFYRDRFYHFNLPSNKWTHVVIVKEMSNLSYYLNGQLYERFTGIPVDIVPNGDYPLTMGAANWGNTIPASGMVSYFQGKLDELFIFNRSLSDAEITQLIDFTTWQPSSVPTSKPSTPTSMPSSSPSDQYAHLFDALTLYLPFNGSAVDEAPRAANQWKNDRHCIAVFGATLTKDRFGKDDGAFHFDYYTTYNFDTSEFERYMNTGLVVSRNENELRTQRGDSTITAWIKLDQNVTGYFSIYHLDNYGCYDCFTLSIGIIPGNFLFVYQTFGSEVPAIATISGTTSLHLNKWYFVAIRFAFPIATFYVNGRFDGSGNLNRYAGDLNQLISPSIGGTLGGNNQFLGSMDDFMFYNRALLSNEIFHLYLMSKEENFVLTALPNISNNNPVPSSRPTSVQNHVNVSEDLVLYLPFTNNLQDASGHSHEYHVLTWTDNGIPFTTDRHGYNNNAGLFGGDPRKYFAIANHPSFEMTSNAFTITAWIYPTDNHNGAKNILTHGYNYPYSNPLSTAGYRFAVMGAPELQLFAVVGSNFPAKRVYLRQSYASSPVEHPVPMNEWSFVAVVIEPGKETTVFTFYVNNKKFVVSVDIPDSEHGPAPSFDLTSGQPFVVGDNYGGKLDEIRIFNRKLSSDEILSYYNASSTNFPTSQPSSQPTGIIIIIILYDSFLL